MGRRIPTGENYFAVFFVVYLTGWFCFLSIWLDSDDRGKDKKANSVAVVSEPEKKAPNTHQISPKPELKEYVSLAPEKVEPKPKAQPKAEPKPAPKRWDDGAHYLARTYQNGKHISKAYIEGGTINYLSSLREKTTLTKEFSAICQDGRMYDYYVNGRATNKKGLTSIIVDYRENFLIELSGNVLTSEHDVCFNAKRKAVIKLYKQ